MQIAICDDDPMIIKELQKDLEQYFRKHHLSCPPNFAIYKRRITSEQ